MEKVRIMSQAYFGAIMVSTVEGQLRKLEGSLERKEKGIAELQSCNPLEDMKLCAESAALEDLKNQVLL